MDPSGGVWLEIAIFGGLLFVFMYFVAVRPNSRKNQGVAS